MSLAISQLSCFSSINRRQHFRTPSYLRPKVLAAKSQGSRSIAIYCSESKAAISYTEDAVTSDNVGSEMKDFDAKEHFNETMKSDPTDHIVSEEKRAAKIHDFCFGIPYGGFVLSWGVVGSIFTRNLSSLSNGLFFGGALLAFSIYSLKIWRQGKSSMPFTLGQAGISAMCNLVTGTIHLQSVDTLMDQSLYHSIVWHPRGGLSKALNPFQEYSSWRARWGAKRCHTERHKFNKLLIILSAVLLSKNIQSYLMTKKVFPIVLYAAISAFMLCFYTYVVMSGGNPPPKKLKSSDVAPS